MEPSVERFRALARSSPWRWSTLRYVQHRSQRGGVDAPVRILVRRPKQARIGHLDGTLVRVLSAEPQTVAPLSLGGHAPPVELPGPTEAAVEFDSDGLVLQRPGRFDLDTDAAMVGNYYDVALLDPVELADGHDGGPGTTIEDLRVVDHRGRQAWEVLLRPTRSYDPRCPCCALLLSARIEDDGFDLRADDPAFTYPDAHRVRLDVGTGVCVSDVQIGGSRDGDGHDIEIEAVDEPMGDELFPPPARTRWWQGRRPS